MARNGSHWVGAAMAGALLLPASALAQIPDDAALPTAEEHPTATLPEASPHWVYILEPVFPHLVTTKVWIVDGDTLDVVGMINGGYTANLGLADGDELYMAETFWSRGSRGDRTDVVTTFDGRTLDPKGEVPLPQGRFLVVPKKYDGALTTDGRYMLSFNMDPATSVSVVDVENQSYLTDIETPGCALMFPSGPRRFSMICADGSMLTVNFDESGQAEMTRSEPFFDAENDPVFEHPGFSTKQGQAYFVSYRGMVYPVDFSGDEPQFGEPWSLFAEEEKGHWWPGGWQVAAYHPGSNRLFVNMHEGTMWTHKHAGEEVWVFDLDSKQRLERIPTEHGAFSSIVTQDDQPLLFTLSETQTLSVFDGTTYEHKGDVGELGISPYVLYVTGE
jgi:methylamine dehydrogenase heavy chain